MLRSSCRRVLSSDTCVSTQCAVWEVEDRMAVRAYVATQNEVSWALLNMWPSASVCNDGGGIAVGRRAPTERLRCMPPAFLMKLHVANYTYLSKRLA